MISNNGRLPAALNLTLNIQLPNATIKGPMSKCHKLKDHVIVAQNEI